MTEYIDKKAVLEIVSQYSPPYKADENTDEEIDMGITLMNIAEDIEMLPTTTEDNFCKDCYYADFEWIPCSKELPEYLTVCLVTYDFGEGEHIERYQAIGVYYGDRGWYIYGTWRKDVIAWMDLPMDYEEKENDD